MSYKSLLLFLFVALAMAGNLNAALAISAQGGSYQVQLSTDPAVVPVGKAQLVIKLQSQGKPVSNATIKTLAAMPGMPMGERETLAQSQPGQPGTYTAPAGFAMAGGYEVTLDIDGPSGKAHLKIPLQTGQNTAQSVGIPWLKIVIVVLLLAALAFIFYRMRITRQRFLVKEAFRPAVLISIAVPLTLLFLAVYAVRNWRRSGSMTPIQMMGMSMEMPAPTGVLPVQLATVTRGNVSDQVVYSGQAVGYVEQNIYPRVDGVIEWMPFYAGDKIHKGQLLARLDTSQFDSQVAAQKAAADAARQQIGIAQSQSAAAAAQSRQAKEEIAAQANMVAQAQHQADMAKAAIAQKKSTFKAIQNQGDEIASALQEAKNNYQASLGGEQQAQSEIEVAREAQAAAQAKATAAKAMIDAAQTGVASAQADVDYWKTELSRMKVLLQGNAVSQQAYDADLAKSKQAAAKLIDSKAQVQQAQAKLIAAQAKARVASAKIQSAKSSAAVAKAQSAASKSRIAQAEAAVQQTHANLAAAKADVAQAQSAAKSAGSKVDAELSNLRAQRQAAGAAQSDVAAAIGRIGTAQSGSAQAQAQLSSAEINKGYTLIRSQVDGVVTKRLISPGVLVKPGDAILQVAQINPIRLQANVAEEDLAKIHLGTAVTVSFADDSKSTFTAKVTSITPSVDAASRTGVVEALVDNPKAKILPGQYVKMAINVGQAKNALQVPSGAIQWQADSTDAIETTADKPYVWMAKPVQGEKNAFTAQQVIVRLGASNGDVTAVLSGLKQGWKVVLGNQINLADGMALVDVSAPHSAPAMPKTGMPGMKM